MSMRTTAGLALSMIIVISIIISNAGCGKNTVCGGDQGDWLGRLNAYRALAGIQAVVENPLLSAGAKQHARYVAGGLIDKMVGLV